jgi:hypothetical protein
MTASRAANLNSVERSKAVEAEKISLITPYFSIAFTRLVYLED